MDKIPLDVRICRPSVLNALAPGEATERDILVGTERCRLHLSNCIRGRLGNCDECKESKERGCTVQVIDKNKHAPGETEGEHGLLRNSAQGQIRSVEDLQLLIQKLRSQQQAAVPSLETSGKAE